MRPSFLSRAVTWTLLPFMIAIGPIAVLASFQTALPPGIMDGDDDDGAASTLSYLDLKPTSLVPSALLDLSLPVSGIELVQTDERTLSVLRVPPPTRSPPLV